MTAALVQYISNNSSKELVFSVNELLLSVFFPNIFYRYDIKHLTEKEFSCSYFG